MALRRAQLILLRPVLLRREPLDQLAAGGPCRAPRSLHAGLLAPALLDQSFEPRANGGPSAVGPNALRGGCRRAAPGAQPRLRALSPTGPTGRTRQRPWNRRLHRRNGRPFALFVLRGRAQQRDSERRHLWRAEADAPTGQL